jgi:DNA-binding FadR family transcriptional regulator
VARFKPVKQNRVSENVRAQLKEAILKGRFKAGDKLPTERELSSEFMVSRAAVREAIRALEQSGFLVTRQGISGGAFVTELSFEQVGDAFLDLFLVNKLSIPELAQVRCFIEPEVARRAAENMDTAGRDTLRAAEEAEYLPDESPTERIMKLTRIHLILAENCGNHFFDAIVKSVMKLTGEIIFAVESDHSKVHGPGEHKPVVEAVLSGDPQAAFSEMNAHLQKFTEKLIRMEKLYRQKFSSD